MKKIITALFISLSISAPVFALDVAACVRDYDLEAAKILQGVGSATKNMLSADISAQQKIMAPVYSALKSAAEKADACERKIRASSIDIKHEDFCSKTASAKSAALHKQFSGANLSRSEQIFVHDEILRITDERADCLLNKK